VSAEGGRLAPKGLTVVPANEAACDALQTVFGTRGAAVFCQCQRYKLGPREAFSKFPVQERARRLREQTACGRPGSETTSGLVASLDGEPVGSCAVEPRTAYTGLARKQPRPLAWGGRRARPPTASGARPASSRATASAAGESHMRSPRGRRLRALPRRPRDRVLPDAHEAGPEDQLGRDPRR
jgi:hypothetical protein